MAFAQGVERAFPELVADGGAQLRAVDDSGLVGVLVSAVNELSTRVAALERLDQRRVHLHEMLPPISGAVQVLEELLESRSTINFARSARSRREPPMAYMRVTRSRVDPARVDDANAVLPDLVASIRQLPGFQSLVVGGNRSTGEAIAVSTFDTEEHARWTANPNTDNAARIRAAGIQMDSPEFFEVSATS